VTAALLVMELAVVSLLLGWAWVTIAASPWPAPWPILLIAPAALLVGRRIPLDWRRHRWFDACWWAVVALVVAFVAEGGNVYSEGASSASRWNVLFIAGLILAWRGSGLSEGWIDRELIESELQIGTVVVLAILVALVWVAPGAGLIPAVTFAAAGLLGLGLARRAERRDPRAGPETDWLVLLGGLVAVIVLVAVAVVLLVTPDVLLALWEQVQAVARAGISGLGVLFAWIGSFFQGATGQPDQVQTGPGSSGGMGAGVPTTPPASSAPMPPFWMFELFLTFVGVLFLFFAVRALLKLIRSNPRSFNLQLLRQREPAPPLSSGDVFTWGGWWASVRRRLWNWLRGGTSSGGSSKERTGQGAAAAEAEKRSIRALYRDLLTAAARAGFARQPSTTPNELARHVTTARPAATPAMSTATELYVRARYGQEHVGRDELSRMRTAVQQARKDLTAPRAEEPADTIKAGKRRP
jgi:hypothetical protein